jgi:phosphatidylserine decarboxylase
VLVQIVVNSSTDVFGLNQRVVVHLADTPCGDCLMVVIGAAAVGSIRFTRKVGDQLQKGDELGYFAYGGSTVMTLFKRGQITFDADLAKRSLEGVETLVRTGTSLGRAGQ